MNFPKHMRVALSLAAGALLLAACGGGSSGSGSDHSMPIVTDPPVAGSDVPQSATTSSAGALAYVKSVGATSDNTSTPVNVGAAVLATSDTDEPDQSI